MKPNLVSQNGDTLPLGEGSFVNYPGLKEYYRRWRTPQLQTSLNTDQLRELIEMIEEENPMSSSRDIMETFDILTDPEERKRKPFRVDIPLDLFNFILSTIPEAELVGLSNLSWSFYTYLDDLSVPVDDFETICRNGQLLSVWPKILDDPELNINSGLIAAAGGNQEAVAAYLVSIGADSWNEANREAIKNGHFGMRAWLLQTGKEAIDSELFEKFGLDGAYESGKLDIVIEQSKNTRKINYNRKFNVACETGNWELIDYMIETYNINPQESGLYGACKGNHQDVIDFLLEKGNEEWEEGFEGCCRSGNIPMLKFFIEKINIREVHLEDGLYLGAESDQMDVANLMIEMGARDFMAAFRVACEYGHRKMGEFLLEFIDEQEEAWKDGLNGAVRGGKIEMIKWTMDNGASVYSIESDSIRYGLITDYNYWYGISFLLDAGYVFDPRSLDDAIYEAAKTHRETIKRNLQYYRDREIIL